jgi:Ankyrin repeats (3 copies)
MKIIHLIVVALILLQAACGPKTGVYKSQPVVYKEWSSVPAYIKKLKPNVAMHAYAKQANAETLRNFIKKNRNEIKPIYYRQGVMEAVKRNNLPIVKIVMDAAGPDKRIYATNALAAVKSKKVLDYLLSQGASANGIPYDIMKNIKKMDTLRVLASQSVFMHMGPDYGLEGARLLVGAGADPHHTEHGVSVIEQLEKQAVAFSEHSILMPQVRKMEKLIAYLKTATKLTDLEKSVIAGDFKTFKRLVNDNNIMQINSRGYTLLHYAAREDQLKIVKHLVKNKPGLMAVKNKSGKTPLALAKLNKTMTVKYLSCKQNKYCKDVAVFGAYINNNCSSQKNINNCVTAIQKDIHGVFRPADMSDRITKHEYNKACARFKYKKCLNFSQRYKGTKHAASAQSALEKFSKTKGESIFNSLCGEAGSVRKCKSINKKYPGMIAVARVDQSLVFLSQKCRLKEKGWVYKSNQCLEGLAHGKGEAVNFEKNLGYKGKFVKGKRVKGKVFYNGKPMFDGVLSNGKPNGEGICFYQAEPEKCEFYEGKRVDVLYKQRIANARQEEKMDAKLAEMQKMQKQQNDRISQMQGQMNNSAQQNSGPSVGQQIGDYAMKKAGEKVMDKLFDRLF